MKKLGYPQALLRAMYLDCKKRTKKDIPSSLKSNDKADEDLIEFMLENTSITGNGDFNERAFSNTSAAIFNICRQLCPGKWCDRSHCLHNSSGKAYNCSNNTRPSVCKEYQKYAEKKMQREKDAGYLELVRNTFGVGENGCEYCYFNQFNNYCNRKLTHEDCKNGKFSHYEKKK